MIPKPVLFIILLAVPVLIGLIGSYFTVPAIPYWYSSLQKPIIAPPNWIFGPVWTALYILMGIASFLIVRSGIKKKNIKAIRLYVLQLFVNLLWSFIFFGLQSILGGMIVIVLLWILIFIMIKEFLKINKLASILLWPYLAWVTFASILNLLILLLNQ